MTLEKLNRLVGTWTTEATHPAMPGVVVHGTANIEWLEGRKFLIIRARTDHADFPDSISIIGFLDNDRVDESTGDLPKDAKKSQLQMQYYDSRGVFRSQESAIDDTSWRWWRDAPGFAQRFTGTFSDDNNTIAGQSQLSRDNVKWEDDLKITYHRS